MVQRPAAYRIAAALGMGALGLAAWSFLRERTDPRTRAMNLRRVEIDETCVVGMVGARDARLWFRLLAPGPLELSLRTNGTERTFRFDPTVSEEGDFTGSVRIPNHLTGAASLEPLTRYEFTLRHADGRRIADGRFETAPAGFDDAPDRIVFGLASCHQPFASDGTELPRALAMLRAAEKALEAWDVKRMLLIGDQMYADWPPACSLFNKAFFRAVAPPGRDTLLDCTADEVRKLYQERYRSFLGVAPWLRLQQQRPCLPMVDDHEIVDNFGSAHEHDSVRWAALRQGALDACHDYQWSRVRGPGRPTSSHYGFDYGPVGAFVMDLRSERRWIGEELHIVSDEQLDELRQWLAAHEEHEVVLLGLTVPLVHVPDWLAWLGVRILGDTKDAADRWNHPEALRTRNELLRILGAHQRRATRQRLVLLGGDVHVGCAMALEWEEDHLEPLIQLVSSAVSNLENPVVRAAASELPVLMSTTLPGEEGLGEARLLPGVGEATANPFSGLNIGLLEICRNGGRPLLRYVLLTHDEDDPPRSRIVFDTGEI